MHASAKKLEQFLAEDIGKGDITSRLLPRKKISATIISRQNGIIAGVKYAKQIFQSKKCRVLIHKKDGQKVTVNDKIMTIVGDTYTILSCERTVLNLMSRMSGIATQTRTFVKKIHEVNPKMQLYSTRKTAPGLRLFDKEAVEIGGGNRHRMSLDESIMVKDNHIAISDSLERLIEKAKRTHKKVEVEVENLRDALIAARKGVDIIMLDNRTTGQIQSITTALRKAGLRRHIKIEASGGINLENVKQYARTDVDIISVGKLTNSVNALDLSLEI